MSKLDNMETLRAGDPQGMGELIFRLPEQCQEAREIAEKVAWPAQFKPRNAVVLGMGGSAIGGDLVRSLLEGELKVPMQVNRDYDLPAWVNQDTLVVASSYSGNTEETLSGYDAARQRGAQVVAITTGGKLAERAKRDGVPLCIIPAGLPPRAALGYSLVPLFVMMGRMGLVADHSNWVDEAIQVLKDQRNELGPAVPTAQNRAKQLAELFFGKIPLVYGGEKWRGVAAMRWKTQLNENAKALGFWNAFPELNHNETVGWEAPERLTQEVQVVLLRDREDSVKISKRMDVTAQIMRPHVAGINEVWSVGTSPLARLLSLVYVGDFTTYYLAIMYGIDPFPVRVIDFLKSQLATV